MSGDLEQVGYRIMDGDVALQRTCDLKRFMIRSRRRIG